MSSGYTKTPVSRLQEYLVSKKMIPIYELTHNGVGTHNPEFTVRVQVEDLWEEGTDSSKKRAKHQAAQKMLRSLGILDFKEIEEKMDCKSTPVCTTASGSHLTDEEVIEKYNAIKSKSSLSFKDPTVLYKDNHNAYIILQEMSLTLLNIVKEETVIVEDALNLMKNISQELGVELSTENIPSNEEDVDFVIMTLYVNPPAAGVGYDKPSAALNLIKSLLFLSK